MKKKLLMAASYLLVVVLAVTGTVAYLTDTDEDVNVMTLGSVKIEQVEQERNENGELAEFSQAKPAYPAVGPVEWDSERLDVNGTGYKVFTDELKNVVDKIVTVNNTGKSDAYIRTLIAIEAPNYDPQDLIHINYNGDGITIDGPVNLEMDGVLYSVFSFTYSDALPAGEKSAPSLLQVFLDAKTTNEDCAAFGDAWEILVRSQAVQTNGFDDAKTALDTAFGEVNTLNVGEWFGDMTIPVCVSDVEEFAAVLSDAKDRAKQIIPGANGDKSYREHIDVILTEDLIIDGDTEFMYTDGNGAALHFYGVEGTIDLNGHDIIVAADALMEGKTSANAALLIQYSNIDIIGDGSIITYNKSIPVYGWANGTVNIYGGTYVTNAPERNESAIYVNNSSMVINVYGGDFEGSDYAFNVHDNCGSTPVLILHEGVSCKQFFKGSTDLLKSDLNAGRIQLADGCTLEESIIDGATRYTVAAK